MSIIKFYLIVFHNKPYSYFYTNTHFSKKDDDEIQKNFIYSIENHKFDIDIRSDSIDGYFNIVNIHIYLIVDI